jgi:hypothetical protein
MSVMGKLPELKKEIETLGKRIEQLEKKTVKP